MSVNVDLLDRTLAHIEEHEDQWEQRTYRCESGMCFAGWAAVLSGGRWHEPEVPWSSYLVAADDDPEEYTRDGRIHVHERAQRLLGIDDVEAEDLFSDRNTLDDLRRIVAEIKADAA